VEPGDARRVARFGGAVLAGMVQSDQVGFLAGAERGLLAVQPPLGLGEFMPSRVRSRINQIRTPRPWLGPVRLPSPIRGSQRLPASRHVSASIAFANELEAGYAVRRRARAEMRTLRSQNKASSTQRIYSTAARQLIDFLDSAGRLRVPEALSKRDIEAFMEHMTSTRSASTANVTYRALQQWFRWMIDEEEIAALADGADAPADRAGTAGPGAHHGPSARPARVLQVQRCARPAGRRDHPAAGWGRWPG